MSKKAFGTSASIEETFQRMLDPSVTTGQQQPFIPSASYTGSRPGYVFRASELGTGYHLDANYSNSSTKNCSLENIVNEAQSEVSAVASARPPKPKTKTPEELLEEAEAAAATTTVTLDPLGVSKSATALCKVYEKNQLQRSEFPENPEKYMNSEVDLHDALQAIHNVAADPLLYKYLYGKDVGGSSSATSAMVQGAVHVLIQSFTHENIDIVVVLLDTWNELLDADLLSLEQDEEQRSKVQESIGMLGYNLLTHQGIETLCTTLARLEYSDDTGDDSVVVYKKGAEGVLTLIETLLDLEAKGIFREIYSKIDNVPLRDSVGQEDNAKYEGVVTRVWKNASAFISWLLHQVCGNKTDKRMKSSQLSPSDMQQIILSSSDLLATILQHEDGTSFTGKLVSLSPMEPISNFGDEVLDAKHTAKKVKTNGDGQPLIMDGIDMLLQAVAPYRKRDPFEESECEHLENCFDCLTAALLHGGQFIVQHFVDLQGIELMLRFVTSKLHAGSGALRVLNFCLSGIEVAEQPSCAVLGATSELCRTYESACSHFVDAGGLKVLFPILMGRGFGMPKPAKCTYAGHGIPVSSKPMKERKQISTKKVKKVKQAKKEWVNQVEINVIYILYALTRYLRDDSLMDAKTRLLAKFVEADCVSTVVAMNPVSSRGSNF